MKTFKNCFRPLSFRTSYIVAAAVFLASCLLLCLLASCTAPENGTNSFIPSRGAGEKAGVVINVSGVGKDLSVSLDPEIKSFQIKAEYLGETEPEHTSGEWTGIDMSSGSAVLKELDAGPWRFYVRGLGSGLVPLYEGNCSLELKAGKTATASITLFRISSESTGKLGFDITVPYKEGVLSSFCVRYRKADDVVYTEDTASWQRWTPLGSSTSEYTGTLTLTEGRYIVTVLYRWNGMDRGGETLTADVVSGRTTVIRGSIETGILDPVYEVTISIDDLLPYIWNESKVISGFYDKNKDCYLDFSDGGTYTLELAKPEFSGLEDAGITPVYSTSVSDMKTRSLLIIGSGVSGLESSVESGWFGSNYKASGMNEELKAVYINIPVTEYALQYCRALKTVVFGTKCTSIDKYAFLGTMKLKELYIPAAVKTIKANAFLSSGIKTVSCWSAEVSKPAGWEKGWSTGVSVLWAVR